MNAERDKVEALLRNGIPIEAASSGVRLMKGGSVRMEPISWLWEGWLARGKLHVIAGAPGCGKSTVALAFAATITRGGRWPDGTRAATDNVLVWSGEDDPGDTLMPRFVGMGGDPERVYFVGDVSTDDGGRPFDPARDMTELLLAAREIGSVGLVLVDPIVNAVEGDSHKNGETRRALQPVVDLAGELNAAALGISHYTKGTQGRDPTERVTGSIAFGALPRIIMGAAKSSGDEDGPERLLVRAKSNIGPDGGGYGYELQQSELDAHPGIIASGVLWGNALEGTARDLLGTAERTEDRNSELEDAIVWLQHELRDGPVKTDELKQSAKAAGMSWRTLERAKSQAGAQSKKLSFSGGWAWALKGRHVEDRQESPQELAAFEKTAETRATQGFQPVSEGENPRRPPRPPTVEGGGLCGDDEVI